MIRPDELRGAHARAARIAADCLKSAKGTLLELVLCSQEDGAEPVLALCWVLDEGELNGAAVTDVQMVQWRLDCSTLQSICALSPLDSVVRPQLVSTVDEAAELKSLWRDQRDEHGREEER